MTKALTGKKIAILATDGFEMSELMVPRDELTKAGAEVRIISSRTGRIQGYIRHDKADMVPVDQTLIQARSDVYDALVLPGGVMNPDALRIEPLAVDFVRGFVDAGKPVAAICHGPWTLINADGVNGHRLTSWPSLKEVLRNAGADWVDETAVVDRGLVTSRKPEDLPVFCQKMIEQFVEGPRPDM